MGSVIPEGPELARSRDFLQRATRGKHLTNFDVVGGRYRDNLPGGYAEFKVALSQQPMLITGVAVKGKFMWWELAGWHLWTTYGMSGQWTVEPFDQHSVATATFVGPGSTAIERNQVTLNFRDPRHFGTLKFVNDPLKTQKKLNSLGPDMLSAPPALLEFSARLDKRANKPIGEVLLDQSVISGVGNYIRAEALYLSELSPHRTVSTLLGQEREVLRQQIINVMRVSYSTGGATISTYRDPSGASGSAQERFVVYGRASDPMGNPVIKEEVGGRTIHWCPAVQR